MSNAELNRETWDTSGAVAELLLPSSPIMGVRSAHSTQLISPNVLSGFMRLADFSMLSIFGLVIAFYYVPHSHIAATHLYLAAGLGAGLLAVVLMDIMGHYRPTVVANLALQIPTAITAWTITIGLFVAAIFFFKVGSTVSRVWMMSWYVAGAAGLIATRGMFSFARAKWAKEGRLNKRAVVYGGGSEVEELLRALESKADAGISICGVFDERDAVRNPTGTEKHSKLGALDELMNFARNTRVDLIILSMPLSAEKRLIQLLETLSVLPVDIRLAPTATQLRFNPRTYSYVGNVPMIALVDKPITEWGNVAKSTFDRTIGLLALILLAPLMGVVALAIRLDSKGPVIFRQKRYGFNNELVEVFKFRSMYVDMTDAQAAKLVTKDDPRVTPIGRFIRQTSIDELPQLFNVLLGTLSLVGPRPHATHAKAADKLYDVAVDNYFARHKVQPGITGWAQVNGWRGETDTEEKIRKRVEHDLYYIDNWSLFFDLYILAKTPFALLKTDNAY